MGDPCTWIFVKKETINDKYPKVCGVSLNHADDFFIMGDHKDKDWMAYREKLKAMYEWGTWQVQQFRFTGADETQFSNFEIETSYEHYAEDMPDIKIEPSRLNKDTEALLDHEVTNCKECLGSANYCGVNNCPLIQGRCSILSSWCKKGESVKHAKQVKELIKDIKKEPKKNLTTTMRTLPTVKHWTEVVFSGFGDGAPDNRPDGRASGGTVITASGEEVFTGETTKMNYIAGKAWKLERVSKSSNEVEIQSMNATENTLYRCRLVWAEINGSGYKYGKNYTERAKACVAQVRGILATDSKGGFDAVTAQESASLGMKDERSAIEALQLKQRLEDPNLKIVWLSSDWNLADCMTKIKPECRRPMEYFLKTGYWRLKYDPDFIVACKKKTVKAVNELKKIKEAMLLECNFAQKIGKLKKWLMKGP